MSLLAVLAVIAAAAATITLTPLVVTFLLGLALPVLNGFIFRFDAPAGVKQAVGVVTAGIAGVVNSAVTVDGAAVISTETFLLAAFQWLVAILSYHGLYKPHGLNESTAPTVGIGGPRRPQGRGDGPPVALR